MNTQSKSRASFAFKAVGILIITSLSISADGPKSKIDPSGDQYSLLNDPDGTISLSTDTLPAPDCSEDKPTDGQPPIYTWDYGSDLDVYDDMSGNLTIFTDAEGDFNVTVICSQNYTRASDGVSTYDAITIKSD